VGPAAALAAATAATAAAVAAKAVGTAVEAIQSAGATPREAQHPAALCCWLFCAEAAAAAEATAEAKAVAAAASSSSSSSAQQQQVHRDHADMRRGSGKCSTYAMRGSGRTGARTLRRAATRKAKRSEVGEVGVGEESDDEFCDSTTAPECPRGRYWRGTGLCGCSSASNYGWVDYRCSDSATRENFGGVTHLINK
jgi:hypothetical protein